LSTHLNLRLERRALNLTLFALHGGIQLVGRRRNKGGTTGKEERKYEKSQKRT